MEYIIAQEQNNVGILTLNRVESLNAVCLDMLKEIATQAESYDLSEEIGAIILRGSEKAFAAGIDLNEISARKNESLRFLEDYRQTFKRIRTIRKPLIAAVAGYALGIGCELAMSCDILLAADNARFGQPEITLGSIAGFGGTQMLTHAVGKAKAMEMILTGRAMNAEEAERAGLVSRIVPLANLYEDAQTTAEKIASMPAEAVLLAKDSVKHALNTGIDDGIDYEEKNGQICLTSQDFAESLQAFIEKRPPNFRNR